MSAPIEDLRLLDVALFRLAENMERRGEVHSSEALREQIRFLERVIANVDQAEHERAKRGGRPA